MPAHDDAKQYSRTHTTAQGFHGASSFLLAALLGAEMPFITLRMADRYGSPGHDIVTFCGVDFPRLLARSGALDRTYTVGGRPSTGKSLTYLKPLAIG